MTQREPRPLEAAVLDGLGSREVLIEKWTFVRGELTEYARSKTPERRLRVNQILRDLALTLVLDVKNILPARENKDLWEMRHYKTRLCNPIWEGTLIRSREWPVTQELLDTVGIEVLDEELPRLLGTADRVLARLHVSAGAAQAATVERKEAVLHEPPTGKEVKREPPVWLKDGSDLAPAVKTLLLSLPAATWEVAASKGRELAMRNPGCSTVSLAKARNLSRPLQDHCLIERIHGEWRATAHAQQLLRSHPRTGDSAAAAEP
jgi:hypothetical protein